MNPTYLSSGFRFSDAPSGTIWRLNVFLTWAASVRSNKKTISFTILCSSYQTCHGCLLVDDFCRALGSASGALWGVPWWPISRGVYNGQFCLLMPYNTGTSIFLMAFLPLLLWISHFVQCLLLWTYLVQQIAAVRWSTPIPLYLHAARGGETEIYQRNHARWISHGRRRRCDCHY